MKKKGMEKKRDWCGPVLGKEQTCLFPSLIWTPLLNLLILSSQQFSKSCGSSTFPRAQGIYCLQYRQNKLWFRVLDFFNTILGEDKLGFYIYLLRSNKLIVFKIWFFHMTISTILKLLQEHKSHNRVYNVHCFIYKVIFNKLNLAN